MANIVLATMSFEEVSLFTSSIEKPEGNKIVANNDSTYTLGLLYLHSYLESKGHNVKTCSLLSKNFEEDITNINNAINTKIPDYIGFKMYSLNRVNTYRMIEMLHRDYPSIQIVLGGVHATIMYEQLVEKYPYVIVVRGEGEITFLDLIEANDLSTVEGIAFFENGKVIINPLREPIKNLDVLPFPKHEVVFNDYESIKTTASVISSRGCYFSCSFCVLNPGQKRTVRYRSVKNIIDELIYITTNYPQITKIFFLDDSFTANNKRTIEICTEIINKNLNHIEYVCSARIKPFTKEMLPFLEKANFRSLCFGFESGNEELLKRCHKNITNNDVLKTMKILKNSPIEPVLFLIVGLPGETKHTIDDTICFIKKLQRKVRWLYFADASVISVYPGTEIYEDMKTAGKIDDSFWLSDETSPVYTVDNSLDELFIFKKRLLDQVTLYPLTPIKFINQIPNSYNIIRYVSIKLYHKFKRIRNAKKHRIGIIIRCYIYLLEMYIKTRNFLLWYISKTKEGIL